jgi:choline kinase
MKHCIILAAGKNSRLDTGKPKSLLEISGITLLERHIRNFRHAGVDHFCVVTGHNPAPIRDIIPTIAASYGVSIDLVHNERYDLENGYSLNATQAWVEKKQVDAFFLTMGDHAFQQEFVTGFKDQVTLSDHKEKLFLAVDTPGEWNSHIDLEDVTKVLVDDLFIQKIGKRLTEYNRFDTGLFFLKKEIYPVLDVCFAQSRYTLSDMVSELIQERQAKVVELMGYLWNDVDNHDDLNNTIRLGIN